MQSPDELTLWTSVDGSGPPIVLCHGGPGLWDSFDPLAYLLSSSFSVHRWDQRGCGRSAPADDYGLDVAIQDLQNLKASFGVRPPWVVLGHSWGAHLALLTALEHPETTRGLIYISGTGSPTWWKEHGLPAYRAERNRRLAPARQARRRRLGDVDRSWDQEVEYRQLSWVTDFANQEDPPSELDVMANTDLRINWTLNARLASEQFYVGDGLLEACQRCPVPSLFIHGSRDPRPEQGAMQLAEAMPHAEFVMIDGAGHFPWIERPTDTFSAIETFIHERI